MFLGTFDPYPDGTFVGADAHRLHLPPRHFYLKQQAQLGWSHVTVNCDGPGGFWGEWKLKWFVQSPIFRGICRGETWVDPESAWIERISRHASEQGQVFGGVQRTWLGSPADPRFWMTGWMVQSWSSVGFESWGEGIDLINHHQSLLTTWTLNWYFNLRPIHIRAQFGATSATFQFDWVLAIQTFFWNSNIFCPLWAALVPVPLGSQDVPLVSPSVFFLCTHA